MKRSEDSTDLSMILSQITGLAIARWQDDLSEIVKETTTWLNHIIYQTREDAIRKKGRCEICNSKEEASQLELHHLAGRKHDGRTVTACKRCHNILTEDQGRWDRSWLLAGLSENERAASFLFGLGDILYLKARISDFDSYNSLADKIISAAVVKLGASPE